MFWPCSLADTHAELVELLNLLTGARDSGEAVGAPDPSADASTVPAGGVARATFSGELVRLRFPLALSALAAAAGDERLQSSAQALATAALGGDVAAGPPSLAALKCEAPKPIVNSRDAVAGPKPCVNGIDIRDSRSAKRSVLFSRLFICNQVRRLGVRRRSTVEEQTRRRRSPREATSVPAASCWRALEKAPNHRLRLLQYVRRQQCRNPLLP